MWNLDEIFRLHDLALQEVKRYPRKRDLFAKLRAVRGRHAVGVVGPRGAGKSVLLRQLTADFPDSLYLSADTLSARSR